MTELLEKLEAKLAAAENGREKIDVLNELARSSIAYDDMARAIKYAAEAYKLSTTGEYEAVYYEKGEILGLRFQCDAYAYLGQYDQALSMALNLIALTEHNETFAESYVDGLIVVGDYFYRSGNYADALDHLVQALKICEKYQYARHQAKALEGIAYIYDEMGEFPKAIAYYQKSLQIRQQNNNKLGISASFNNIAVSYWQAKEFDKGLSYALKSLQLAQQEGLARLMSHVLDTVGAIYLSLGEYDQAVKYLQQAVDSAQKAGVRTAEIDALLSLGKVYSKQENQDTLAFKFLNQALALAEENNVKPEQFKCHQELADIYERRGEYQTALTHQKKFYAIEKEVFNESADQKLKLLHVIHETETARQEAEIHRLKTVELQEALDQVRQLSGLLPICANCKKIRDDDGYWQDVAVYIRDHSEAEFSHSICPACAHELYPGIYKGKK